MLQLHDRMKGDEDVSARLAASGDRFSGGLDVAGVHRQVSHAAIAGQYQLEQTFLLPVASMQ